MSEKKALAAACASYGYAKDQVRAERVNEMLVSFWCLKRKVAS